MAAAELVRNLTPHSVGVFSVKQAAVILPKKEDVFRNFKAATIQY
jgi:hypothetical protein